ncbi:M23 family metallopeptidase [Kroppenstedtia eburnea]|uniref:Peptidase family M23 n=1 Tax=Kroppenstedtia eburnea TaxID=714067 RepID=A0A1N7LIF0_9BACL|nr:M23 family metallopeptidase [Kroppenstedtia eburnea]QKI81321.1 peptidoglycan DD-metalloendopeptidase family protein [Kroppenstedtia eburnea]SIS73638.1 Peptidase family M23 [Kroppenstedtia eburnea]
MKTKLISVFLIILLFVNGIFSPVCAREQEKTEATRQSLFEKVGTLSGIPWYVLAAMDQYERNLQQVRQDLKKRKGPVAITVPPKLWSGITNPDPDDTIPESIRFFGGIGRDGNGDGKADPEEPLDVLYTITRYLREYGDSRDDVRIGLWNYYQHPTAVDLVTHYAEIYRHFGTTHLDRSSFVMPLHANYTYHDTWGARRGWGGIRIHEGTDIFAGYGTPVLSTVYGYVELKGWNRYGGWRIGIRDLKNNYHYFAHLSSFDKNIRKGSIVQPGQVLGYVGSSGYGPPGTSGKFPPHLHYGIYKFNGNTTYSFDPYPFLKARERAEYKKQREARKAKKNLKNKVPR